MVLPQWCLLVRALPSRHVFLRGDRRGGEPTVIAASHTRRKGNRTLDSGSLPSNRRRRPLDQGSLRSSRIDILCDGVRSGCLRSIRSGFLRGGALRND